KIQMTLTSPMCPAAEMLPGEVETKARGVEGVTSVELDLVWDPPWSPDRMSEAAKLELGMV
nr:iron-sulfur cluster assembly protein [Myxococcota bacterium]